MSQNFQISIYSISSSLIRWMLISIAVAAALAVVFYPTLKVRAALVSQVNQAMREAGISVTATNNAAWAEGVLTGHYKSYGQLVGAMKWHKLQGKTTPDSSKFTKAVAKVVAKKKTAQGTVTSYRAPTGSKAGSITIAKITYRLPAGTNMPGGIQVGSNIKVTYEGSGKVRDGSGAKVLQTGGTAQESGGSDSAGDCASCSGGGGGSEGTT